MECHVTPNRHQKTTIRMIRDASCADKHFFRNFLGMQNVVGGRCFALLAFRSLRPSSHL